MLVFNFLYCFEVDEQSFCLPSSCFDIIENIFHAYYNNCLNFFQLARLPQDDMNAVNNMRLLGGASETNKSSTSAFSLKFDIHEVKINC